MMVMKKNLFDILIERKQEQEGYFGNYINYAKKIKKVVNKFINDEPKVYVFGSVVKQESTARSDIDVIIVVPENLPSEKYEKMITEIYKSIGVYSPFEIHIVNENIFAVYRKMIDKMTEI